MKPPLKQWKTTSHSARPAFWAVLLGANAICVALAMALLV